MPEPAQYEGLHDHRHDAPKEGQFIREFREWGGFDVSLQDLSPLDEIGFELFSFFYDAFGLLGAELFELCQSVSR